MSKKTTQKSCVVIISTMLSRWKKLETFILENTSDTDYHYDNIHIISCSTTNNKTETFLQDFLEDIF